MNDRKPILCLDFDGVIHSYTSDWESAALIPDPPVPGALDFILVALDHFRVCIYSSRSGQIGGVGAMQDWLEDHFEEYLNISADEAQDIVRNRIQWPMQKPPAFITIDDRALTFTGVWPTIKFLQSFKPWNKKE
ncbi:MAG: hypothetical protein V6Z86_05555 [Hyphomicrobiales bacterium]